jgi:hypothetical protein
VDPGETAATPSTRSTPFTSAATSSATAGAIELRTTSFIDAAESRIAVSGSAVAS